MLRTGTGAGPRIGLGGRIVLNGVCSRQGLGTSVPKSLRQGNPLDSKRKATAEEITASVLDWKQSVNRFRHRRKPDVEKSGNARISVPSAAALVPLDGAAQAFAKIDDRGVAQQLLGQANVGQRVADVAGVWWSVGRLAVVAGQLTQNLKRFVQRDPAAGSRVHHLA